METEENKRQRLKRFNIIIKSNLYLIYARDV